jgi:hypothetical protein
MAQANAEELKGSPFNSSKRAKPASGRRIHAVGRHANLEMVPGPIP